MSSYYSWIDRNKECTSTWNLLYVLSKLCNIQHGAQVYIKYNDFSGMEIDVEEICQFCLICLLQCNFYAILQEYLSITNVGNQNHADHISYQAIAYVYDWFGKQIYINITSNEMTKATKLSWDHNTPIDLPVSSYEKEQFFLSKSVFHL